MNPHRGVPRWKGPLLLLVLATATFVAMGATPTARAQELPTDGTPLCGTEAPPSGSNVTPARDDGVLRVATFNVLHSETDEGDASLAGRLPLIAAAIAGSRADIVGAQEVTRNIALDAAAEYPQKHGLVAQRLAAAVAAVTGEPWAWCWSLSNPHVPLTPDVDVGGGNPLDDQAAAMGNTPDPGDFSEGLAILTRFSIDDSRFRRLPPRSYESAGCVEPDPFCPLSALFDSRQVLWARVTTPGGPVDMFTTHIAHHLTALSDTTKLLQSQLAADITEEWATDDPLPDFLVGDFNSAPGGAVHDELVGRGFVDSYAASGGADCTATGAAGCSGGPKDGEEVHSPAAPRPMSERIDYVFVRPPAGCTLRVPDSERIGDAAAQLSDGRYLWPSDHYGFASSVVCASAIATPAPVSSGAESRSVLPPTGGGPLGAVPIALLGAALALRRLRP